MAVIRLQKDFDDCRREFELARKHTPAVALRPPRRSGFTKTPVPRYSGKSNWEQYREVFEAIVCSKRLGRCLGGLAAALSSRQRCSQRRLAGSGVSASGARIVDKIVIRSL